MLFTKKNADVPCIPASMTKVMALYVFFSEMNSHGIDFDTPIPISENVAELSVSPELSNVRLVEGKSYSVDQILSAICTASACAAVVALAEAVSGSEEAFVGLMNEYVGRLGLAAYYTDCYGISPYNRITPRSMAALAKRMIDDYPVFLTYSRKPFIYWEGRKINSTNLLLPGLDYEYPGVDGLKTGFTDEARYCMTATAVKDGRRLISSVFDTPGQYYRFNDSKKLLDYGFEHCEERVREFYGIECVLDGPDSVRFHENFTVTATLGNVTVPMTQKGEWLVNGVPIENYRYDSVWIDNGSVIRFDYNAKGFDGGNLQIAFRLYTPCDSIIFEKTIKVEQRYEPPTEPLRSAPAA